MKGNDLLSDVLILTKYLSLHYLRITPEIQSMSRLITFILLSILLFTACQETKIKPEPDTPFSLLQKVIADTTYLEGYAQSVNADQYGMSKFVIAFLKKGPNRPQTKEEENRLQMAHMDNINKMAEAGKLVMAGPFFGDGDLRGLYIFDVQSIEEAKALTESDPAIQAGSLAMELKEWYGSAALKSITPLHFKAAKINM